MKLPGSDSTADGATDTTLDFPVSDLSDVSVHASQDQGRDLAVDTKPDLPPSQDVHEVAPGDTLVDLPSDFAAPDLLDGSVETINSVDTSVDSWPLDAGADTATDSQADAGVDAATDSQADVPTGPIDGGVDAIPPSGTVATLAGTGFAGWNDGLSGQAMFNFPERLGLDSSSGAIYVADNLNYRIRRIKGGYVTTAAGSGVNGNRDGSATVAELSVIQGVAPDGAGAIYLADAGNRSIRVIRNGAVSTIADNSNPNDAGPVYGNFVSLHDLVYSGGDLYLEDDKRLRKITLPGLQITTITTAALNVAGFDRTAAGAFYYSMDHSQTSQLAKYESGTHTVLAGLTRGFQDGPSVSARFNGLSGVAVAPDGTIYMADRLNHRIRAYKNGQVTTVAGTGVAGFANGPLGTAQFDTPTDVLVDSAGRIYVADAKNHMIRVISP